MIGARRFAQVGVSRSVRFASSFAKYPFLRELGLTEVNKGVYNGSWTGSGEVRNMVSPATDEVLGQVQFGTPAEYEATVAEMDKVKARWAALPAPVRGEIVRKIGVKLREKREALGHLVSLEMGKIRAEGVGEV